MGNIKLLDCTLRDGGYINDWRFGNSVAKDIIASIMDANIDIIEVGFLRDEEYNPDRMIWNCGEQVRDILPTDKKGVYFSAMILHDKFDISHLGNQSDTGIDLIRVTFHDYDVDEGLDYCKQVMSKGYRVSCNPINIMGYTDEQLLTILSRVNEIKPYAFSIVDTFGSMDNKDLDRLVALCDHNLDRDIVLGLHLHENKAQSFSLSQRLLDKHLSRDVIIDGSLNGMGRIPGNLSIELMASFLNDNYNTHYEIDYLLDAIETYITPIKDIEPWGYSPAFFLSAKYNLHRNYAEYFLGKGNLTHKDINHLLSSINDDKKTAYDINYASELYVRYMNHQVDDLSARKELGKRVSGEEVLLVAPGRGLVEYREEVQSYIMDRHPIVITINFVTEMLDNEISFFTNNKRYAKYHPKAQETIITSNIDGDAHYVINYNGLISTFEHGDNSLIMALRLLKEVGVSRLAIAGADGYKEDKKNYFDDRLKSYVHHNATYNQEMKDAIKKIDIPIEYITPSLYE